eukprot:EG_transcript_39094
MRCATHGLTLAVLLSVLMASILRPALPTTRRLAAAVCPPPRQHLPRWPPSPRSPGSVVAPFPVPAAQLPLHTPTTLLRPARPTVADYVYALLSGAVLAALWAAAGPLRARSHPTPRPHPVRRMAMAASGGQVQTVPAADFFEHLFGFKEDVSNPQA